MKKEEKRGEKRRKEEKRERKERGLESNGRIRTAIPPLGRKCHHETHQNSLNHEHA